VELASKLYPTERMRIAVEALYMDLLKFFIRAYDWCHEGSLLHALHSITRPVELRYHDLLDKIAESSRSIHSIAVSASQVEVRYMHNKMNDVLKKLDEMKAQMIG
jgi:hypothetical protein